MRTLKERLRFLLDGPPKISQAALARACKISAPSVHDWLTGKTKNLEGENLLLAARFLGVSPFWLATGKGPMKPNDVGAEDASVSPIYLGHDNVQDAQIQGFRRMRDYPLISWVIAGSWIESHDNYQPGDGDEMIPGNAKAGDRGYWLEVKNDSMMPTFPEGTRILIQPEGFDIVSGKYYIAKINATGETTFKQYSRDAGVEYLVPLNDRYAPIRIVEGIEIIGRVVDFDPPKGLL